MTKMTQKNAIAYVIENCDVPKDVKEKLISMKAQLEKKSNSTGEKKLTKTQIANEKYKEIILAGMRENKDRLYTITEIAKEMKFDEELSSQRVSAIVKQLKDSGAVERIEEKRKAYFRIV